MKKVTFNNASPPAGALTDLLHTGGEASERKLVELENTRMSVAGISGECGFSSQSYFTRIFREKTGMTPNEYRRRQTPHTR